MKYFESVFSLDSFHGRAEINNLDRWKTMNTLNLTKVRRCPGEVINPKLHILRSTEKLLTFFGLYLENYKTHCSATAQ